jgi:3'-5' exoribonuclease
MSENEIKQIHLLSEKDIVSDRFFLVKDKNYGIGKNGRTFLSLLAGDKTGQIDCRVWDNVDELNSQFEIGDFVKIKGAVQIYNQRKQLIVHKLENANTLNLNKNEFVIEHKKLDTAALFAELHQYVHKINSSMIKQLCLDCITDNEIKNLLLVSPAAKTIHHAERGGLLEHIVSICKLMDFMGGHYKHLNKDFLYFGAIFHDLGKIWELEINNNNQISYTQKGQLLGHMYLSCELIEKKSQKILGFPDDLRVLLKHIVLGHHGKIEYGSPKLPMFPEAFMVAMIDDLDSKTDQVMKFVKNEQQSGESWSRYHENLERYFYIEDLKDKWL